MNLKLTKTKLVGLILSGCLILLVFTAQTAVIQSLSLNLATGKILNFKPCVTVAHADGSTTFYQLASNTVAARGAALATAFSVLAAGDTVELRGGSVYEIPSPIEIMQSGVTFDGHGATIRLATLPGLTSVSTTVSTNLFNKTSHGMVNGAFVYVTGLSGTTGVSNSTYYYVVNAATNTFQLSATFNGSPLTLGGSNDSSVSVGGGIAGTKNGSVILGWHAARASGTHIKNILFDCNMQNQGTNACVGAVTLYGGNYSTIENCRGINWGTKSASAECFVFSIPSYDDGSPSVGNRIINCQVDTPAPILHGGGGATGISIFGNDPVGGDGITPAQGWQIEPEISGCLVRDVVTQGGAGAGTVSGQPQNFNAFGMGLSTGGKVHHNRAYNITSPDHSAYANGYYADTGTQRDMQITDNTFVNCRSGVQINPAINAAAIITNMLISRNYILPQTGGAGIVIDPVYGSGGSNAHAFKNIIRDNFVGAGGGYGIFLNNCKQTTVQGNIAEGSTAAIYENTGVGPNFFRRNFKQDGTIAHTDSDFAIARVSTQFDKTNTTLANVSGLTADVAAGKTYAFRAVLFVQASAGGGFKATVSGTATATAVRFAGFSPDASDMTASSTASASALGTLVVAGIDDAKTYATIDGTITVNAGGTLTVQFAQNNTSGTSSVLVGSTFQVTEVP